MKRRIRHIYQHGDSERGSEHIPRGWINPDGRFLETKEHWASITGQFRKADISASPGLSEEDAAAEGERVAHLAYGLGWISVGHGKALNAIGHERTFRSLKHPASLTLRKLLSNAPQLVIHVETQIGDYDPSRGIHEDFDVREYDLDVFIKTGRLRQSRTS